MVEQIKALCAANNTNVKSLEKELGFGNGTIRRWDERKPSYDRIESVARRFGVPVSYLTGEGQKKDPLPDGRGLDAETMELIEFAQTASPAERKMMMDMIENMKKLRAEP